MDISINGAGVIAQFENVPLLGTVQLTQTLFVSWLLLVVISALCIWLGSNLTVTNITRKQAVAEMGYNAIVNFVRGNMGPNFDHYIPLVCTIFITSVISNLVGLVGLYSPTADLMTELAWALVVFVLITYHKIKASGIVEYIKGFFVLDPNSKSPVTTILGIVMSPLNVVSECFTPVSMACRHFGNILSGSVINALIYGALTAATAALFGALGSSMVVAAVVTVIGIALFFVGKKIGKTLYKVLGIIVAVLGVLAVLTNQGIDYPWLTIGIPAIPSLYFDWFGGCIQAFIFCTLTTLFIKQAADG